VIGYRPTRWIKHRAARGNTIIAGMATPSINPIGFCRAQFSGHPSGKDTVGLAAVAPRFLLGVNPASESLNDPHRLRAGRAITEETGLSRGHRHHGKFVIGIREARYPL
jgi:hypothetical protein